MDEHRIRVERKIDKALQDRSNTSITSYTSDKLKNIHQFLNQAENNQNDNDSELQYSRDIFESDLIDKNDKKSFKQQSDFHTFGQMELEQQKKTIETLKELLKKEQDNNRKKEEELTQKYELQNKEQKLDYEKNMDRSLKFVDQLIQDKKDLNEQCDTLMNQLKDLEQKNIQTMMEMKDSYQNQINQLKEIHKQNEKKNKEKWITEKTQEIKDKTLKGLEPELDRLIQKNKQEITQMKKNHQKEIEKEKELMMELQEQKVREIREKLNQESDLAISKERDYYQQRIKEQLERCEIRSREEIERLRKQQQEEIDEIQNQRKQELENNLQKNKKLQESHLEEVKQIRLDFDKKFERALKTHKQDFIQFQEDLKQQHEKQKEIIQQLKQKEFENFKNQFKKQMETERDNQIQMIIEKLSEENSKQDSTALEKYKVLLEQQDLQHKEEIKQMRRETQVIEEKFKLREQDQLSLEVDLRLLGDKVQEFQHEIYKKDQIIYDMKAKNDKLDKAAQEWKEISEQTEKNCSSVIIMETSRLREEIKQLEQQTARNKVQYEDIINRIEEDNIRQLEEVEQRVKKAILKKESELQQAKTEIKFIISKCNKYEELLDKQRQDLLSK